MPRAELTLFAHIAARPDGEIDLAQSALLIAEDEYPGLDVAAYIERLDRIGADARELLLELDKPGDRRTTARLERVLSFVRSQGVDAVVFDAAEYGDVHPLLAPFVLLAPLEWFTVYSCVLRGITDLDERIFMGKGILAKPGISWP